MRFNIFLDFVPLLLFNCFLFCLNIHLLFHPDDSESFLINSSLDIMLHTHSPGLIRGVAQLVALIIRHVIAVLITTSHLRTHHLLPIGLFNCFANLILCVVAVHKVLHGFSTSAAIWQFLEQWSTVNALGWDFGNQTRVVQVKEAGPAASCEDVMVGLKGGEVVMLLWGRFRGVLKAVAVVRHELLVFSVDLFEEKLADMSCTGSHKSLREG